MKLIHKEICPNSVAYTVLGVPVYIRVGSIKLIGLFDKDNLWLGFIRVGVASVFGIFNLPIYRNKRARLNTA